MGLNTVEPQHVVNSGRKAATEHRICPSNPEPYYEEVVIVHAISISAPWCAALQPWLSPAGELKTDEAAAIAGGGVNAGVVEKTSKGPKGKGNPDLPPMARRRPVRKKGAW